MPLRLPVKHIRGKSNAHSHVGVHVQKGDEHGADDRRRAHVGKKGDKHRKQYTYFIRSPLRSRPDFSR